MGNKFCGIENEVEIKGENKNKLPTSSKPQSTHDNQNPQVEKSTLALFQQGKTKGRQLLLTIKNMKQQLKQIFDSSNKQQKFNMIERCQKLYFAEMVEINKYLKKQFTIYKLNIQSSTSLNQKKGTKNYSNNKINQNQQFNHHITQQSQKSVNTDEIIGYIFLQYKSLIQGFIQQQKHNENQIQSNQMKQENQISSSKVNFSLNQHEENQIKQESQIRRSSSKVNISLNIEYYLIQIEQLKKKTNDLTKENYQLLSKIQNLQTQFELKLNENIMLKEQNVVELSRSKFFDDQILQKEHIEQLFQQRLRFNTDKSVKLEAENNELRNKEKELSTANSQLNESNQNLKLDNELLSQKLSTADKLIKELKQQRKNQIKSQSGSDDYQDDRFGLKSSEKIKIQQIEENRFQKERIIELQSEVKQLNIKLDTQIQKVSSLKKEMEEAVQIIERSRYQLNVNKAQITELQTTIHQQQQKVSHYQRQIGVLKSDLVAQAEKFKNSIKNMEEKHSIQEQRLKTESYINSRACEDNASQLQILRTKNQKLNCQIIVLEDELNNTQNRLNQSNKTLDESQHQLKQVRSSLTQWRTRQQVNVAVSKQLSQLQKQTQKLKSQLKSKQAQLQVYEHNRIKDQQVLRGSVSIRQSLAISRCYMQYFNGYIFEQNEKTKQNQDLKWFVDTLQTEVSKKCQRSKEVNPNRKIKKTNLIYRKDHSNLTDFHKYIDSVEQIVLLVKLKGGNNIIAGYSEVAFIKGANQINKFGVLFSLKPKKCYFLKNQPSNKRISPKPITWDQYYISYGCSQIRLRFGEDIVYSAFGSTSGFYDNHGDPVSTLLQSGNNRETEIQTYEMYQVIWQQY